VPLAMTRSIHAPCNLCIKIPNAFAVTSHNCICGEIVKAFYPFSNPQCVGCLQ